MTKVKVSENRFGGLFSKHRHLIGYYSQPLRPLHPSSANTYKIHSFNVQTSTHKVTQHNDANIIIISTDCFSPKYAAYLVGEYLKDGFDGGERNKIRVNKMTAFGKYFKEEMKEWK